MIDIVNDRIMVPLGWGRTSFSISDDDFNFDDDSDSNEELRTILGFGWQAEKGSFTAAAPFWFLALACVAVTAVPWLRFKRFSLRTLLIATTVVAAVLGLIAWLGSNSWPAFHVR